MSKYGGNNRIDFGVHFNTDKSSLAEVQKAFQKIQDIKPVNFKGSVEELRQIKLQALKVQAALTSAFNVKLGSLNIEKFKTELKGLNLDKLYTDLSRLGSAGQVAFNKMTTSMMTTNLQLKETHSLINSMGTTMMNTVKWGIASSVMNNFTQSVSQAFQYVKSLDSALTDIRIVTGDSTEQMAKFADQANRAAQSLGRSTMDYSKAALTFYQQGLSDEDVAARTEATLKAQNITGAGQEMADYLTAVWNGYKVANEEAELYVDKLAAVADSSASNMSQLAVAMSKVASTANMLGVPVDSLNAQIATIEATTRQAPETVGNALKTIYARINDIKTGSDDAEVSLGNYTEQMAKLGVNVLDASGNLRDTGDVIEEIGGKWESLSREQQIYLARTMAGQRQYNNLLALFENWGKYTDLVNVSMEAQGTTMQKNSRYMDSLAAHMEQLGAAGQRVKTAMIDSDSFKGLIDIGTELTNLFANLVESIGGGGTAFVALGSIVTRVFSGVIAKEITNFINNLNTAKENEKLLQAEIAMTEQLKNSQAYQDGTIKASVDAKQKVQAYYKTMSAGQIQAYNGIVKEISAVEEEIIKIKEAKEASDKLIESLSKGGKDPKVEIDHLISSFEELKNKTQDINLLNEKNFTSVFEKFAGLKDFQIDIPGLDELLSIFERIKDPVHMDVQQLEVLKNKIQEVKNNAQEKIDLAVNAPQVNGQLDILKGKIESLQEKGQNSLDSINVENKIKGFLDLTSAVGRLASGFMAISNLSKVWNDESLSGGQKILQIFTNLGFVIPMIGTALAKIRTSLGLQVGFSTLLSALAEKAAIAKEKQAIQQKKITAEKSKQALIDSVNKGERKNNFEFRQEKRAYENEIKECDKALDNLNSKNTGLMEKIKKDWSTATTGIGNFFNSALTFFSSSAGAITATVGAAVALAAGIGVLTYQVWNKAENDAKKATETADQAKAHYSEVRKELSDLRSSFDNLHSAQDTFAGLTRGTNEWHSALENVNSQVLELCDKFPELAQYLYTTSDGMLSFRDGAEQLVLEKSQQNAQAAGATYVAQQRKATEAQNEASMVQASRDLGLGNWDTSLIHNLMDAIEKHGTQVLDDTAALHDLGKLSYNQVQELQNLKPELITLYNELNSNTLATENLAQSVTKSNLEGVKEYENSDNKDVFARLVANEQKSATLGDQYYKTTGRGKTKNKSLDEEALLERYAEVEGIEEENLRIKKNTLEVQAENGEWEKKLSLENLKQYIAQQDMLKNAEGTYKEVSDKMQKISQVFGANKEVLTGAYELVANKDDFSNIDYSQFSGKALDELQKNAEEFSEASGLTIGQINHSIKEIRKSFEEDFNNFVKTLPQSVQSAFKELGINPQEYSKDAANALSQILTLGLEEGGSTGLDFMKLITDKVKPQDLPGLNEIIQNADLSTLSLDNFKDSLQDAGIHINATDAQLETFINFIKATKEAAVVPQQQYKNIHDVIDNLKNGDTIDSQAAQKLEQAGLDLQPYFRHMADGSLKLKVSAQEFVDYANNISLQGFKDKIAEIEGQINGLQGFQQSGYAYKEGQDNTEVWEAFSAETGGGQTARQSGSNELLSARLEFLNNINTLTEEEKVLVADVNTLREKGKAIDKQHADAIQQAIINHQADWQNTNGLIQEAKDQAGIYKEELQSASEIPLDPDIDEEQWQNLADFLQDMAEDGDKDLLGGMEISETLKEDREAAEDLAEAMLRYDHALEEVAENYDDWMEGLSSGNMQQQAQIGAQLKNIYADMLDLPIGDLSSDFVTNTENLELMKLAAEGDLDAYSRLQEAVRQDIAARVGFDDSEFQTGFNNLLSQYYNVQSLDDIEVGATLNNRHFLAGLEEMVNAAGMTRDQALDYLGSMGVDAEIEQHQGEANDEQTITGLKPVFEEITQPFTWFKAENGNIVPDPGSVKVPMVSYEQGKKTTINNKKQTTGTTLKIKTAKKSSGGEFKFKNSSYGGGNKGNRGSGSGGGKKGGGGSSSKPSIAKTNTTKIDTKQKTQENDPYYKVNKSIEKQSTLLKRLQDQEKNLSGKDRLKNLEAQAKNLKQQNELLEQRNRISNNVAAENSTANLRKRLQDAFGKNISFDSEGKIADLNQTERAAVDSYNKAAQQAQSTFESVQKQYNNWILHTWNANSKAWQEAHQSEKEKWDERIKNAETNAKDAISAAEEEYKKKTDLIKAYEKALQEDQKRYEQYMNNIRKIMESTFEQRKIKIQFNLDSGELDRDWQDFQNKVIRRIKDSDIVGNAAAQFRELSSYIQSQELQSVSDEIKAISDDIARVNAGAWTQLMGISQTDYEMLKPEDQQLVRKEALGMLEEQLKDLVKQEQDALSAIQDLTDEIAESYLDSIDAAKDALDEHIDQYERINDLIEHNVKLTELLYGDKGYDTLNKYYDLQKQNNMNTLQTLKQQEEYWRSRMQNEVVGSEAWKKFKENLDDAVDAVNSKLEDMLDNLTTQFEKKLAAAVERVNNKLTGGLGTSYLDEQWDYLNNYDDYFLDTYNATTGIEDVTRAYQQALDDAAENPKQQQRLNKLMNDQLKILREKDHLTEYDLERAKSMLEVEKARMALEDARNNKTKMRLRRDSQGNYTYQYVADEEKLGDLQQALADAQNDLYNQDKEHYKENLNTLYDTYKEYLEKMQELTEEYRQAQAEAEATGNDTWLKQVQARIDLAKEQYDKFYTGLLEDNEYNQTYVTQAFANGLNLDLSGLSSEEAWEVIRENVPWAASNIQNLANSISNLGGLLPATNTLLQDFSSAATQYKADMNDILEAGGTSIQTIGQVIDEQGSPLDTNIIEANSQVIMGYLDEITQKALTDVNTMQDLTQKLDEYWQNLNNNIQTYINNTREAYNTLQELLDSSTRAEVLDYTVPQTNTTSTEGLAQAKEQLSLENISGEDIKALYDSYLSYLQNTNGALEVPRSQVQYQQLAENQQQLQEQYDRFYTDLVQDMIQQVSSMSIDSQIDQMTAGTSQLLSNLIKNQSLLDQNVHIDANFPNVNNHTQIEEAFNNLVNMAAMRASGYRD